MRKNTGFTLLELMIAIAIIVVATAVVTPNLISWFPKFRLSSGARNVMTDLQLTRMRAIKENTVTFITFNTANETYAAFIDNGAGSVDGDNDGVLDQAFDGIQNGTERTFLNGDMPAGVDLTSTEFTANRLRFDMRGLPSEGGDVRLTGSDGGTRDVNVGMAGNIRIEN